MPISTKKSVRSQLMWLAMIIATVSIVLSFSGTLYLTLKSGRDSLDSNLISSASILSQSPLVRETLQGHAACEELAEYLDAATANTSDIDLILVADAEDTLFYAPDPEQVGTRYTGCLLYTSRCV